MAVDEATLSETRIQAPVVEISNLSVAFGRPGHAKSMLAVDDVSLVARQGEIVCLVGPSGCGKSTVLNVLAGSVRRSVLTHVEISGNVHLNTRAAQRNRQVGYMFQQDTLLPWKTALQNVALPLRLQHAPDATVKARTLLETAGLGEFCDRYPKELSGGMRKRVQMAQLLAQDPEVLLMDEPFGALDAQTRTLMQQEFLKVWERDRKTIIFVTHDFTEAILLGDRILSMSARPGRIKRETAVGIPRPRSLETLVSSVRYADLHRQLWSELQAEADKTLRETTDYGGGA